MIGDHEAALADTQVWSPARAIDDARGPRCGNERKGVYCCRERGHDGDHLGVRPGSPVAVAVLVGWRREA